MMALCTLFHPWRWYARNAGIHGPHFPPSFWTAHREVKLCKGLLLLVVCCPKTGRKEKKCCHTMYRYMKKGKKIWCTLSDVVSSCIFAGVAKIFWTYDWIIVLSDIETDHSVCVIWVTCYYLWIQWNNLSRNGHQLQLQCITLFRVLRTSSSPAVVAMAHQTFIHHKCIYCIPYGS
jgi:hypothetical protein